LRKTTPVALAAVLASVSFTAPADTSLTLADATARALAKNHDIAIEKESFRIAGASLSRAEGAYDPSFRLDARYRDRTDPVNSILSGAPEGADAPHLKGASGSAGVSQLLPTGATVSLTTSVSRDTSDNTLTLLTPSYTTSFGLDVRQPLLQNRAIDPVRRAIRVAGIEKGRSTASLKRTVAETVAAVERAYWTLVAARREVAVRRSSVTLADEQRNDAQARIEAGTLPESDIAQPTAEVERRRGELYAGEESLRRAELQLKTLILAESEDPLWGDAIDPADSAETAVAPVDLAAALKAAEESRPEIAQGQSAVDRQEIEVAAADDRVLPQLDLVASYARRGLAGSLNPNARSFTGQPTTVSDQLDGGLGRSLGTIPENRYPDASIGLALTIPIGNRQAHADAAIARSQKSQAAFALAQLKQRVAVEVRNAANALQTAAQRIEAARSGRQAAETQLRAEKERFAVGLSTNFFVLTRQNDLTRAQETEITALTDYRKALTELARSSGTLLASRKIEIDNGGIR